MRYGKGEGVPLRAQALILAEKGWGHPEDIMRRPGGVAWLTLQAALDDAREKSRKMDEQKNKK